MNISERLKLAALMFPISAGLTEVTIHASLFLTGTMGEVIVRNALVETELVAGVTVGACGLLFAGFAALGVWES